MTPLRYGMTPLKLPRSMVGTLVYVGGGWGGGMHCWLSNMSVSELQRNEFMCTLILTDIKVKKGAHTFQRLNYQCTLGTCWATWSREGMYVLPPVVCGFLPNTSWWGITYWPKHILHGRGTCVRKIGQAKTAILCEETCQARNIPNTKTAALQC